VGLAAKEIHPVFIDHRWCLVAFGYFLIGDGAYHLRIVLYKRNLLIRRYHRLNYGAFLGFTSCGYNYGYKRYDEKYMNGFMDIFAMSVVMGI